MSSKTYWLTLFQILMFFIVIECSKSTSAKDDSSTDEGEKSIRSKRNIICFLGLTEIIKDVLNGSIQVVHEYDPLKLGDTPDGKLKDGLLRGLSTLNPVSDMDIFCDDDRAILNTTLRMKNAEISYRWKRRVLFKFSGTIKSKADEVEFNLQLSFSMQDEVKLEVSNTLVTRLDGFKFGFSGLGPFNPLVKGVVNGVYKIWSRKVTKKIERLITKSLQKQLSKLSFL